MEMLHNANESSHFRAASYLRRSSGLQADTYSIETQKRVIAEECARRGLSDPVWYEDEIAAIDLTTEEKDGDETTESK